MGNLLSYTYNKNTRKRNKFAEEVAKIAEEKAMEELNRRIDKIILQQKHIEKEIEQTLRGHIKI